MIPPSLRSKLHVGNSQTLLLTGSLTILLGFVSCNNVRPTFEHMSEEELISYNASQPIGKNIICFKKKRAGSHLKEKLCLTISELASLQTDSVSEKSVKNGTKIYSPPSLMSRDY